MGTLQRIGKIIPKGYVNEMAFTGDDFNSTQIHKFGLVNEVYEDFETLLQNARKMAENISKNSPLVVQSTKYILKYSEKNSLETSLDHVT
jgi:enoyl-CoA hydratase